MPSPRTVKERVRGWLYQLPRLSGYRRCFQPWCGSDRFCNLNSTHPLNSYPTASGANPASDGDAFVAKISPDGSTLLWATFLGGSSGDVAAAIAVDGQGDVYVGGWTASADFP